MKAFSLAKIKSTLLLPLLALGAAHLTPSTASADVSKSQRALIVLSELEVGSSPELAPLYTIMERLTADVPRSALGSQYASIKVLRNSSATLRNLKTHLYSLAANPQIKAIDMIVNTHGSEEVIHFYDGGHSMRNIKDEIADADAPYTAATYTQLRKKLRMLYSTACFAATHNLEWLQIGFDVSSGAIGVNANAEIEYPSVIHAWSTGQPYSNGFRLSNTDAALLATDGPVRLLGEMRQDMLREVNSKKRFLGHTSITINTDAR